MKKEDIFLVLGIITLIGFFIGTFYLMQMPPEEEATTNTPQQQISLPPQDGNFNPNYGELTEDQIQIADIAIGNLLNSSEGVTPPMITVQSFEAQQFPNAALGCPQEGQMYAEVVTDGYQVILEAQGQTYDYRLTDQENVILCE